MFASVGFFAYVPILIPGGIGKSFAKPLPGEASKAAPPKAILTKSRLCMSNPSSPARFDSSQ